MKLTEFVKKYSKDQVIDSSTFSLLGEDPQNIRCQVQYWRRQGHLILLKRGGSNGTFSGGPPKAGRIILSLIPRKRF